MEQAGCAGGDAPGGPGAEGGNASTLARRLRAGLVSRHPGGVGAPPGDTTIPRQELANVDPRVLRRSRRSPWNGQKPETGVKEANPRSATSAARRREPAPACRPDRHGTPGQSPRWSAGRRAGPRHGPVISGRYFRRSALPRGGPPGASVKRTSAVQRSIPLTFLKGTTDKAQPARRYKRAAERWLRSFRGATNSALTRVCDARWSRARNP